MVLPRKADPRELRAQCSNRRPKRVELLVIRCAVAGAAPAGGGALRPVGARLLRSLRATVALKAGRGAKARRARPRAERWRLALGWWPRLGLGASEQWTLACVRIGAGLLSLHVSARVPL